MFSAWQVQISLLGVYNGADAFRRLSNDTLTAESQTNRLTNRMRAFGQVSSIAIGAAAFGMGELVKTGYQSAVEQIDAMTTATLNFNASLSQTAQLHDLISDTSNQTAQSFTTTAEMASKMAQLSFTVEQTKRLFPSIARDADLMQFLSGANPVEATKDIGQMAHLYGVYDEKGVAEIGRQLVGLSKTQPESLAKVVTQSKYFAPLFSSLGVSVGQSLAVTAGMGIMGFLQSKGGTSAANAILGGISATVITGHLSKARATADQQSHLGLMDKYGRAAFYNNQTKSFDLAGMFTKLVEDQAKYRNTPALGGEAGFVKDLTAAFGTGAVSFILANLRPETIKQVAIAQANMRKEDTAKDYALENQNMKFVTQKAVTTFSNVMGSAFTPLVQWLTPHMHDLADTLAKIDTILRKNSLAAWGVALGSIGGALALAGIAAWKLVGPILGISGAMRTAGTASTLAAGEIARAAEVIRLSSLGLGVPGIGGPSVVGTPSARRAARAAAAAGAEKDAEKAGFKLIPALKSIGSHLLEFATFGAFSGAANWTWLPRVGAWFAGLAGTAGEFIAAVNPVTLTLGLVAGGFVTLYEYLRHPTDFGRFAANVQNWFQYKFWPAIRDGFLHGMNTVVSYLNGPAKAGVLGAFGGLIGDLISLITTYVGTSARVFADAMSGNLIQAAADAALGKSNLDSILNKTKKDANDERWRNDQINRRAADAYDKQRAHAAGANNYHTKPSPKQIPHAVSINNTNHITVVGATGADHQVLAQKIAKFVGDIQEKNAARAIRSNGGMSTNPFHPQAAVGIG